MSHHTDTELQVYAAIRDSGAPPTLKTLMACTGLKRKQVATALNYLRRSGVVTQQLGGAYSVTRTIEPSLTDDERALQAAYARGFIEGRHSLLMELRGGKA